MEIQQAQLLALEAENAILQIVRDFTVKTGLAVADINFEYSSTIGHKYHQPMRVILSVHI